MRRSTAQEQHVARAHDDLGLQRAHFRFAELDQVRAPRRLAPVDAPLLRATQVNRQHVVGVDVSAVGFVTALREEHYRVAERASVRPVERRREQADLRLEDIDAFEQEGRPVLQVLLQHAAVDEFDRTALNEFYAARVLQVDELPTVDDLQEFQMQKRVVEVFAQVLEAEDRLVLDQARPVQIAALRRQRRSLLEKEISHQPQLRRKLGHVHSANQEYVRPRTPIVPGIGYFEGYVPLLVPVLTGPAKLLVYNNSLRKIIRHAALHAGTEPPHGSARDPRTLCVPR